MTTNNKKTDTNPQSLRPASDFYPVLRKILRKNPRPYTTELDRELRKIPGVTGRIAKRIRIQAHRDPGCEYRQRKLKSPKRRKLPAAGTLYYDENHAERL